MDFQQARGVDVVLDDPYKLPLDDASVDIVVSSSCFEHSEMFWLVFLEVMRVLKSDGLFYLNAPSAGSFHQYPVDCWRFYPDSGKALITWAKRNGFNSALLESYTQIGGSCYQDFVSVFIKNKDFAEKYPQRILDEKIDFENGQIYNGSSIINPSCYSQNEIKLTEIQKIVND